MEIVDVEDAGDGLHRVADGGKLQIPRGALEEDVEGFADNADGTPEDHGGDDEREDWVDPGHAGKENGCTAYDNGSGGESVAEHVQKDTANVDIPRKTPEQGGHGAVHQNTGGGDVHHQSGLNGDRDGEPVDGLEGDPGGEDDEGSGIDEGRENTGALVAEGLLLSSGTCLKIDGNERKEDRKEVAEVMASLGDKGQRVGAEAEYKGGDDVGEGQRHGKLQNTLHLAVRRGDHVHMLSVVFDGAGFNPWLRVDCETLQFCRVATEVRPDAVDRGCTGSESGSAVIMHRNLRTQLFERAARELGQRSVPLF